MNSAPESNHRKASDILRELAQQATGERISLRDIVEALGERAFGVLMLILSLPNAVGLGMIPGVSTLFGLPQIFLAVQMVLERERLWLPARLLDGSISRHDFQSVVDKSMPYILKVERFLRPRWNILSTKVAERLLGLVFLVLAIILALPIPFGNEPPGLAMAFIAIGLIARDGLYVTIGLGVAVFAIILAGAVVVGGITAIWLFIRHVFGG
jgi:hypothetical protein